MTVDEALEAIRERFEAAVLVDLAEHAVAACAATAGPQNCGKERRLLADLRARAGRIHDGEMGLRVRVGTPPKR